MFTHRSASKVKVNISSTTKTYLTRGVFYVLLLLTGTLLVYSRPAASTKVFPRTLTFAQRVSYQRAIEEVYWRHRIWPKDNPQPQPPLAAIVSEAQLEQKVEDYLRKSQLATDQRQSPITASELQAEMERMAAHTKQPKVLRELFEALGNDPFVIAECLARRLLADRRTTQLYRHDQEVGAAFKQPWLPKAETQVSVTLATVSANYTLPVIASPSGGCTDDTWTPTSLTNAPSARNYHTAVWTGSEMIIWGGWNGPPLNTGGRYDPTTDSWTATSTANAPTARLIHTAVWTGSEMIVWGGFDNMPRYTNTGGRYNPSTDSWTPTSTANAPTAQGAKVWTGSEMIVWGGSGDIPETGGRYNPSTDSWTTTSTDNVPSPRNSHTAVWTGTEMIVWGGTGFPSTVNTGGRYDPSTDSWTATSTTGAPAGRIVHTAVWTGTEMIVWGGQNPSNDFNTGGRYNPGTDSWTTTSTASAPAARHTHTAVWTGSEMIVWGGETFNFTLLNTGGRYCAQSGASTPTPTPNGCSVVSTFPACGSVVMGSAPTYFTVQLSDAVDQATLEPSDFMVNGTPADSVI